MASQAKRGNHHYYYRKKRDGFRVKSVYFGRGEMAYLDAVLFEKQQEDRGSERAKRQQELEAVNSLEVDIDALSRLTLTLTEAALIAAGFHQHKREWRKRRT